MNTLIQSIKKIFTCANEQQISPRIHFVLILITLLMYYFLSFLLTQFITISIPTPSLSKYKNLSENYSNVFQCSCSKFAFKHKSFLTIKPRFHELCSNEFIMSDNLIGYTHDNERNRFSQFNNHTDYGAQVIGQFQLLVSFCKLSQKTIHDSLSQLVATDYVNNQLISPVLLDKQINVTI